MNSLPQRDEHGRFVKPAPERIPGLHAGNGFRHEKDDEIMREILSAPEPPVNDYRADMNAFFTVVLRAAHRRELGRLRWWQRVPLWFKEVR